ncbi:MAG: hypothetical protein CMJ39_10880 [Phycisphaerae bacterium]|nr:hypothetical protein [Phycisphaerae bacterium]|tara:strand:- start:592 stop:1068 length:477 start_codon:yes stop_codon:yes gene_type:complete
MIRDSASNRSAMEIAHEVSASLAEQARLLGDLKQLAMAQGPLIKSGEHDSLVTLIRRRQEILTSLGATRSSMSPLLVVIQKQSEELPESTRLGLRKKVEQVRELVAEIAAIDCADSEVLQSRHAHCRNELEAMAQAGKAKSGYREEFRQSARFADATG